MEERNISITLKKAREWYKQGGDLREVALQAFSEQELECKVPTSWKGFIRNGVTGWFVADDSMVCCLNDPRCHTHDIVDRNIWPSKELAEASLALCQLFQLYEAWVKAGKKKGTYGIRRSRVKRFSVSSDVGLFRFANLSDTADFLETFINLFEVARPLIA